MELGFEKMDVFRMAVEFRSAVERVVPRRGRRDLRDQLERAANSVVLNLAEGAGRRGNAEKAHFYGIARGSANECMGVLAILQAVQASSTGDLELARDLLVRVVQMLNRLIGRFSNRAA